MIFGELKKYVDRRLGGDTWPKLLREARLGAKIYSALQEYPDQEVMALVAATAGATGRSAPAVLEDFGEFLAPDLIGMFKYLIKREWMALDLIQNTEAIIHSVVRIKNPGAKPPRLVTQRPSAREIVITYDSARRMCSVAKGIIKGVGKHYGEPLTITESACMLTGSPACILSVTTT